MIRLMLKEDRKEVLAMMRVFYASPAVLSNGSEEIFSNDFENCIGNCPYLEGYIFEDKTSITGYAMIAKSFSTEFGKPCVWIEDIYIKPQFRGTGLGGQFLNYIEEKYEGHVFRLEAEEENENAVHVYRKHGIDVVPYLQMIKK